MALVNIWAAGSMTFAVALPVLPAWAQVDLRASRAIRVGNHPRSVVAADFDQDGAVDLAVANRFDGSTSMLFVNGSAGDAARAVGVPASAPIRLALDASPSGPSPTPYLHWIWRRCPIRAAPVAVGGQTLGCTVNPTPLADSASPQPLLCARGLGIPARYCGAAREIGGAPARAPFSLMRSQGIRRPMVLTVQGVLRDDGAPSANGVSVTNAVIVRID